MRGPDYQGRSLVNLVAQLERSATGTAPTPGLTSDLAGTVAPSESRVLLLIDGLGFDVVAARPEGSPLRRALRGRLDASFSTQTSVATATITTGIPPSQHGLLGYLLDLPEADGVVNTLWWLRTDGTPMDLDLPSFLPSPNLAERLAAAGIGTVVIEPEGFLGSPLDAVIYRGARTRGIGGTGAFVEAVVEEAARPGSMVVGYLPHVDAAGHTAGPGSEEHREAVQHVEEVWDTLCDNLPGETLLVGTADHGMVAATEWLDVEPPPGVRLAGDSRVLFLHGDEKACRRLASGLPGSAVDGWEARHLWGPEPHHPAFGDRLPRLLVFAPEGTVFHHSGNPTRLAGYHGGLTDAELDIPLLVR